MFERRSSPTILIVEDNDDDFEATERALRKNKNLSNPITRCRDGLDAWAYLRQEGKYAPPNDPPQPGLVLLDLNMPGLCGRKLLSRVKGDPVLCKLPVVVLTTSAANEDINGCYRAGANTYIPKPVSWTEFAASIDRLHEYWFQVALLPR